MPVDGVASSEYSRISIVRARVLPRAKERKPFLIQRRFNLDEMRARSPISKAGAEPGPHFLLNHDGGREAKDSGTQTTPERSKSDSAAKPFKLPTGSKPASTPYNRIPAAKVSRTSSR